MTNEQLVSEIRSGHSVTDNMQLLYENNLPLIKKIIRPYAAYDSMEDLLQESYFGLSDAVQHYETSENVLFMTYARYWIRLSVQRYLEKYGSTVRIPGYTRQKMTHCRKAIEKIERDQSREPTSAEIAALMGVPVGEVQEIISYMQGIASLDTPIAGDNSLSLSDTLQADFSLENEMIDKIYAEHSKNELWGIVARYTNERENRITKEIFINNRTMAAVAREEGLTLNRVRQIKENGLRKLRIGKARRELLEKFDIVGAGVYRNSIIRFNEHGSSTVEYIAIRRSEIQAEYEERKKEIEDIFTQRERKYS